MSRACLDSARFLYVSGMGTSGLYHVSIIMLKSEEVSGSTASLHSLFGRTILWIEDWTDPSSSAIVIVPAQEPVV